MVTQRQRDTSFTRTFPMLTVKRNHNTGIDLWWECRGEPSQDLRTIATKTMGWYHQHGNHLYNTDNC